MDKFTMQVVLEKGAYAPQKAHEEDSGFDIRTREEGDIEPGSFKVFDTGVHVMIPKGYEGTIRSKSGLNFKHNLTAFMGTIDAGYTGSICVMINNNGTEPYHFNEGDKIAQLVITAIPEVTIEEVDVLGRTDRGENGFGSTGR